MERWWDGSLESNGSAGVKDFVGDAESRPSLLLYQTVGTNVHSFRTQTVTKTEARLVWGQSASVIYYTLSVLSRETSSRLSELQAGRDLSVHLVQLLLL